MFIAVNSGNTSEYRHALQAMFAERKSVFVDLLKWDVPVLEGKYEIDQFDDEHAVYLILLDDNGAHIASTRLLRTDRPHILDSFYADLCEAAVPRDDTVREITRFCLSRRLTGAQRRIARNQLVSGIAEYGLLCGITGYTAITDLSFLQQVLAFGWSCRPLGLPRQYPDTTLGALWIDIDPSTIELLRRGGVYADVIFRNVPLQQVA